MFHRGGVAVGRNEGDGGSSSGKTVSSARARAVVPLSDEEEKEEREGEEGEGWNFAVGVAARGLARVSGAASTSSARSSSISTLDRRRRLELPGEEHEERHDAHVEEEQQLGDAREGERARGVAHERLGSIGPERGGGGRKEVEPRRRLGRDGARDGRGRDRRVDSCRRALLLPPRLRGRREFDPGEDAAAAVGTDGRIEHGDDAAARRRLARVQPEEELPARRARAPREGHPPAALGRGLSRGGRRRSERELDEEAGGRRAGAVVDRARVVLGGWRGDAEEDRDVRRAQARDGDGGHAARRGRV